MKKFVLVRCVAGLVAVGASTGCLVTPPPRVGVEYAIRRPPDERVEVLPASPGPEYVWVKGRWGWRRDDYEWIPGHWAVPERGYREWAPGHWDHDHYGWFYIEGRWR